MSRILLLGIFIFFGSLAKALNASTVEDFGAPRGGAERLNRAPVGKDILQIQLPRPVTTKLDNGLTVFVLPNRRVPKIYLSLWILSGDVSDPDDRSGLAQFTADLLRDGRSGQYGAEFSDRADMLGISHQASSNFGWTRTFLRAEGLTTDADFLFDLMSDTAQNPTFLEEGLLKYKAKKPAELGRRLAQPDLLVFDRFRQALFPDSPAAFGATAADSIRLVTRDELAEFHRRHYLPNNALLGIAGDIAPDAAVALSRRYFGAWKAGEIPRTPTPTAAPSNSKIVLIDRPGSAQTNIAIGAATVRRADPDYVPLLVADRILDRRLYLKLREQKGYAYDIRTGLGASIYPAPWGVLASVRNEVAGPALRGILEEFRRLREESVAASELDEAHRSMTGGFLLSLERPDKALEIQMDANYFGLSGDYWERYPRMISQVDSAAVQRLAQRYLNTKYLQIVCVGDAKNIREAIEKIGPVEVRDAYGRLQQ